MQVPIKIWLIGLALCLSSGLALAKPPEMKTHSSLVKGANVTVVHFSAPW
jgi:hypothetical protein